jgi:hypothetical protein
VRAADTIYQSTFDGLSLGQTQPPPGAAGHDGWYEHHAPGSAFGEIQDNIANGGRALHEFAPGNNPPGAQTIDGRNLGAINISAATNIILSADFYAHTSDLSASNTYSGHLVVGGGPHPGFQIIYFGLSGGGSAAKSETGVSLRLDYFHGSGGDNLPLTVGQNLAWDTWHTVSLSLNHLADQYISLTVDGQTQDLSAYRPPRSLVDSTDWRRGQLMEYLHAIIIPFPGAGAATDDDVYWDNISLRMTLVPEPSSILLVVCGVALFYFQSRPHGFRCSLR